MNIRSFIQIYEKIAPRSVEQSMLFVGFLLILSTSGGVIAAAFGLFRPYCHFLSVIVTSVVFLETFHIIKKRDRFIEWFDRHKYDVLIIALILLACMANSMFFSEEGFEGGHDQGVYMEWATLIWQRGAFTTDLPVVLSYPGFSLANNGEAVAHFLPGYSVYLSLFYSQLGLYGYALANGILLFLGIGFLFLVGKELGNRIIGVVSSILFFATYYSIYFSRSSFSENLLLAIFWMTAYIIVRGVKDSKTDYLVLAFIPLFFLVLVRLEAILFLISYCILMFYLSRRMKLLGRLPILKSGFRFLRTHYWMPILSVVILCALFSFLTVNVNVFNESLVNYIVRLGSNPNETIATSPPYNEQLFIWIYLFSILTPIGTIPFLVMGMTGTLANRRLRIICISLIIIALPQFTFLIKPSIAFYLPWLMRRYWPILLPLAILLFSTFLGVSTRKLRRGNHIMFLVFLVSFTILFSQTSQILAFSDGRGIHEMEREIADDFRKDNDLLIFWSKYDIENYGPPLFFYHGIHTLFDRPPAFDEKAYAMIIKDYQRIFLVTSVSTPDAISHPYFNSSAFTLYCHISTENITFVKGGADVRILIVEPQRFNGYIDVMERTLGNPSFGNKEVSLNVYVYLIDIDVIKRFVLEYYDPQFRITENLENFWH